MTNTKPEDRLVAEIPAHLKELVDSDSRSNKDVVITALWKEYGGEELASIERRIDEKKRRISNVESEKNERERELDELREALELLTERKEQMKTRREQSVEAMAQEAADDLMPNEWLSSFSVEEQLPTVDDVAEYAEDVDIDAATFRGRVVEKILADADIEVDA